MRGVLTLVWIAATMSGCPSSDVDTLSARQLLMKGCTRLSRLESWWNCEAGQHKCKISVLKPASCWVSVGHDETERAIGAVMREAWVESGHPGAICADEHRDAFRHFIIDIQGADLGERVFLEECSLISELASKRAIERRRQREETFP